MGREVSQSLRGQIISEATKKSLTHKIKIPDGNHPSGKPFLTLRTIKMMYG